MYARVDRLKKVLRWILGPVNENTRESEYIKYEIK